ncbi:MAG: OadG family transporter subunit [Eubacteriales bacterium]
MGNGNILAVAASGTAAVEELGGAFSSERIMYALRMTLLGICAVFAVLTLLYLVLQLFKLFVYTLPQKRKNAELQKKGSQSAAPAGNTVISDLPAVQDNGEAYETEADDAATVAVITAAIAAYIASDETLAREYSGGFRVVSFRRSRGNSSWNQNN